MNAITLFAEGPQRLLYYPDFFSSSDFERLKAGLPWQQNSIRVFGKEHLEPRLTCWFGPAYRYSSIQWPELPMPPLLSDIRSQLSLATDFPFNAVLANYYRDGNDSMGWHSDNEPEMDSSFIVSASFGGTRTFHFRNKLDGKTLKIDLLNRSLLIMQHMQTDWQHAIHKTKRPVHPRINLTFRRIMTD
jgi:alkylated DNA repair dioxygenase AlkB